MKDQPQGSGSNAASKIGNHSANYGANNSANYGANHSELESDLVAEFESLWDASETNLVDFIKRCGSVASSELQRKLLRCDLRLRLTTGEIPALGYYEKHFPHFASEIDDIVVAETESITNEESPIEKRFGELPLTIGGYEVLKRVGRDAATVHYDAVQISLQRKVRFRVLLFPNQKAVSKAFAVANLEHPNSENIIDVLQYRSHCILVSQIEQGVLLGDLLLNKPDSISIRQSVYWVRRVSEALLELHRNDICHFNVSPFNIIARSDGESALINSSFEQPVEQLVCGSISSIGGPRPFPYRSLERTVSRVSNCAKDDTIALGLVLFQLLTALPMDDFYLNPPLPEEYTRLQKLIEDRLNYSSNLDSVLKSLCLRSTVGNMKNESPCCLSELRGELLRWERQDDLRRQESSASREEGGRRRPFRKSELLNFIWFS